MFLINSILFFTIVSFVVALNADESDKAFIPCGLYGFRCLDKKRAQICDEKREDVECSPKPRIFECGDGLICDEEKKEFCAPMETSYSNCTTGKSKEKMKRGIICKSQYDIFDDIMEPVTTATYTSTADYDDDDEKPIVKPEDDPWNGNPPITCGSHGFYPDTGNRSLFFFCDLKRSGYGFILRHMRCGPNRVFEANFKACILNGTTRSVRNENEGNEPKIIESPEHLDFNCTNKKPGKYSDEIDCHIYHLCLRSDLYSPFEHLTVECPHSTAYDSKKKSCSKKARKLCKKNISCEKPIRFRETRSCNRYFLCYHDQVVKFDCPRNYRFDESNQLCKRKHLVKCE